MVLDEGWAIVLQTGVIRPLARQNPPIESPGELLKVDRKLPDERDRSGSCGDDSEDWGKSILLIGDPPTQVLSFQ